ncbi:hypothetical protein BZA70DRAFT_237582 [Myxozyma melibiosi]|uniref:GDP-Man:Man(3)GlcNAc(2)-PP-Dol alpha-1,2-mannosyltransferase n=1 Tax=Myxozyma melibiosi TaxID=54550 RepID=A0ABR1F7J9_9ASCO
MGSRLRKKSESIRQEIINGYFASIEDGEKKAKDPAERPIIIGFFHPYCNAGGGGERVLWTAVSATQREHPNAICAIYTGDVDVTKDEIMEKVLQRFEIELETSRVVVVFLNKRILVDPSRWPRFTLLGQALGSIPLVYEAISKLVPDVFVDTMGYAFTYPVVSMLLDIPVGAYVHYPMISTDMFDQLSLVRQFPKYVYWRFFALAYAFAGMFADIVMANGTWTYNHIRRVWWLNNLARVIADRSKKLDFMILYPPCATKELQAFPVDTVRQPIVLSIAQFRPEKRHELMLEQFARYVERVGGETEATLVLIGSVRDSRDKKHVYDLRILARELGVTDRVEFILEATWDEIKRYLGTASVGVNAMWNEHFGIGVVEYMAAGLIPVVHNSGGPKLDIAVEVDGKPTGFHFVTEKEKNERKAADDGEEREEMSKMLYRALSLSADEAVKYRQRAQKAADRFSVENFESKWLERLRLLLMLEQYRHMDRISRGFIS